MLRACSFTSIQFSLFSLYSWVACSLKQERWILMIVKTCAVTITIYPQNKLLWTELLRIQTKVFSCWKHWDSIENQLHLIEGSQSCWYSWSCDDDSYRIVAFSLISIVLFVIAFWLARLTQLNTSKDVHIILKGMYYVNSSNFIINPLEQFEQCI